MHFISLSSPLYLLLTDCQTGPKYFGFTKKIFHQQLIFLLLGVTPSVPSTLITANLPWWIKPSPCLTGGPCCCVITDVKSRLMYISIYYNSPPVQLISITIVIIKYLSNCKIFEICSVSDQSQCYQRGWSFDWLWLSAIKLSTCASFLIII